MYITALIPYSQAFENMIYINLNHKYMKTYNGINLSDYQYIHKMQICVTFNDVYEPVSLIYGALKK